MFRKVRDIVRKTCARWYTWEIKRQCASCGEYLKVNGVNGKSKITPYTVLGNHVNFNGMTIKGAGKVQIGSYFHSGTGCLILTQNHDYDKGDAIPYDTRRDVVKEVNIDDFVWLGDRVIILGGAILEKGRLSRQGALYAAIFRHMELLAGTPQGCLSIAILSTIMH